MVPVYKSSRAIIKKHKAEAQQRVVNDLILYSLTTLACTSFCSSPLWYPPFCATFNVFLFLSLPKITLFFFTSKALFIMGNIIVIFLLGESKFFYSNYTDDVCHDHKYACNHYLQGTQIQVPSPKPKTCQEKDHNEFFELHDDGETCELDGDQLDKSFGHDVKEVKELVKQEDLKGELRDMCLPAEELNKLVDDFIARINRQRMLEAEFCRA